MNTQGGRLREERKRIGLSQAELGALGGVRKQAQLKYEKGESYPNGAYFEAIAAAGVDLLYVLTGTRSATQATPLRPDEAALLDNYRHCPPEGQAALKTTSYALAQRGNQRNNANGNGGQ